jgi:hypothetical protein
MSDTYQAVYDAVRSRVSNGDVGSAIERVAFQCFDISNMRAIIQQECCSAIAEWRRPSVLFRPALSIDGSVWCALYGEDLQSGVAGFGQTPEAACMDFDKNWFSQSAAPPAHRNEA